MSEKSSQEAEDFLINLGVTIHKNCRVTAYDGRTITTNSSLIFDTATVIWTAGVQGVILPGLDDNAVVKNANRLRVNAFNQVVGYDTIFAIGDIALMETEVYPQGHPMMAQPALQQGKLLGENLIRKINNQKMISFNYNNINRPAKYRANR